MGTCCVADGGGRRLRRKLDEAENTENTDATDAPVTAFKCECGVESEPDADGETTITYTDHCTDGDASCPADDDDDDDDDAQMNPASAVQVSAVVMMVFSFLW